MAKRNSSDSLPESENLAHLHGVPAGSGTVQPTAGPESVWSGVEAYIDLRDSIRRIPGSGLPELSDDYRFAADAAHAVLAALDGDGLRGFAAALGYDVSPRQSPLERASG